MDRGCPEGTEAAGAPADAWLWDAGTSHLKPLPFQLELTLGF